MFHHKVERFGILDDGRQVESIVLQGGGLTARFLTYGAILQDLRFANHNPSLVLGLKSMDDYLAHSRYFGATAGRYANRIRDGQATIDGTTHQLDRNFLGKHHLHGGRGGMGKQLWHIESVSDNSLCLAIVIPDGDMGFPGTLKVTANFTLLEGGVLDIVYRATTSAPTLCNLAHHSYFNLGNTSNVLDHQLQIDANSYLPVDDELIPTGEIKPVDGTDFDYRVPRIMRSTTISSPHDHNFCLASDRLPLREVAHLKDFDSGMSMHIHTTEAGLQVFDGGVLDVPVLGVDDRQIGAYAGIAIEPQVWPDSPNNSHFPQALLMPSQRYEQHTQFIFNKEITQ